ncbi:MAG: trypsin-like peptidase domain-containing protein [Oscillospiraceae bacterium]|nr:trypsin-like peptidase domain-containing protein [Oscillospiraceae bacterium]
MYYNYNDENENTVNGEEEVPAPEKAEVGDVPEQVNDIELTAEEFADAEDVTAAEEPQPYYEPWRDTEGTEPEDMAGAYSPNYYRTSTAGYSTPSYEKPVKEKKPMSSGVKFAIRAICLILACGIVSGLAAAAVTNHIIENTDFTVRNQVVLGAQTTGGDGSSNADADKLVVPDGSVLAADDIYDLACQQAVGIQLVANGTNIFGQATTTESVIGSGFVISEDGYIITNYHVAEPYLVYGAQGGYVLRVVLYDGTTYDATVIGYEEQNDIAVLKINASGLNPVTIGDMTEVRVGNEVYVVGNPLGELTYTMTTGRVSALDRVISTEVSSSINVFQIDAAVNSGNSDGPVYNNRGEVIGIVDAKYSASGVEGLGFAIPIDDAMNIITDLIEHGYVTGKAYFGIGVRTVDSMTAQYYNMREGAFVNNVETGSCAEKAGLKPGDIIIKLGDDVVKSTEDLQAAKNAYSAGDTVAVTVYRSGEELVLYVTFDEQPANPQTTYPTLP